MLEYIQLTVIKVAVAADALLRAARQVVETNQNLRALMKSNDLSHMGLHLHMLGIRPLTERQIEAMNDLSNYQFECSFRINNTVTPVVALIAGNEYAKEWREMNALLFEGQQLLQHLMAQQKFQRRALPPVLDLAVTHFFGKGEVAAA